MTLALLLHFAGIALWVGAGAAALLLATGAREETPLRIPRVLVLGQVYSSLIAPGAMLATASGIALTMMVLGAGDGERLGTPALMAMQGVGLVAGLLELFVVFPTARRLAGITATAAAAGGAWPGERLRSRLVRLELATLALVFAATACGIAGRPPR